MKKMRIFALVLTLMLLCVVGAQAEQEPEKVYFLNALSQTQLDLAQYEGKAIFLNFLTEWCPYCVQEIPDIKKLFETYSSEELQIIFIHVWDGEDASNTENLRNRFGLEEMTFFEDEDALVASMVGIPGYPTSVFIDKDGYLHTAMAYALSYEQMETIVEEMDVAKAASKEGTVQ